ncbi:MAG: cytochrome c1 [Gammaproteobacteria bacterium]|nr:cytochrome c1 [Gammaproteobacteria bacterium]
MKKLIVALVIAVLPGLGVAAGGNVQLEKANIDLNNKESLQRGAKLFVNYCLSCHSAQYMRYNRMARDLGLTNKQVEANLMFASDKIGETMTIAMPAKQSAVWFGAPPPDLSVITRSRGSDWVYTYLTGFYKDDSRPFGVNNTVLANAGMPHVLEGLEGLKEPVYKSVKGSDGHEQQVIDGFKYVSKGKMSPAEYDAAARDLTAFLTYVGEPAQMTRKYVGIWVLLFLFVLFVVSYYLKKEYWKDIH